MDRPIDTEIFAILDVAMKGVISAPISNVTIRFYGGCVTFTRRESPMASATRRWNAIQRGILEALRKGPLKAERLAAKVGYSKRSLYRQRGGIQDLIDAGLVIVGEDGYELIGHD